MILLQAGIPQAWMQFVPLVLIMLVFYFLMLRPQMAAQKKAKSFRENLKKGERVITSSGIYGKIVAIEDNTILLDVDNNVKLRFTREAISAYAPGEAAAAGN